MSVVCLFNSRLRLQVRCPAIIQVSNRGAKAVGRLCFSCDLKSASLSASLFIFASVFHLLITFDAKCCKTLFESSDVSPSLDMYIYFWTARCARGAYRSMPPYGECIYSRHLRGARLLGWPRPSMRAFLILGQIILRVRGGSDQPIHDDYWSPQSGEGKWQPWFINIDGERGEEGMFGALGG